MAQLKDTTINGNMNITGNIICETSNNGVKGIHPETGNESIMLHMSGSGNTIVGYGGYENKNGNSHIYGNDAVFYIASAGNINFRPYLRAGDNLTYAIKASGYVTNSAKDIAFIIPCSVPIIGSPTATATSTNGFILRQGNKYTHGSAASTYVKPVSYTVATYAKMGFVITASFDVVTDATNNDTIGIYWSGGITLS